MTHCHDVAMLTGKPYWHLWPNYNPEYVGRHRLGPNWCFRFADVPPKVYTDRSQCLYRINLQGGAFG